MEIPIRFPSEAGVIAEEAARFRGLPDEEKVRALRDCFRTYHFLLSASGRAEELKRLAEEEERRARVAIQEFAARHG
jgi:hypothetical protein